MFAALFRVPVFGVMTDPFVFEGSKKSFESEASPQSSERIAAWMVAGECRSFKALSPRKMDTMSTPLTLTPVRI